MSINNLNNEQELFLRIASSDQTAFRHLTDRYWNKLYTVAFTFLKSQEAAKDVVQEVFLKVWLKREQLASIQNAEAWLFILTRNEVLNALKKKRIDTRDLLMAVNTAVADESADSGTNIKDIKSLIKQGLDLLPDQQKAIFILSKEQGLTHEQICEQLNLARSTVKNSLVKALAFLRNYLQQHVQIPCLFFFFNFF